MMKINNWEEEINLPCGGIQIFYLDTVPQGSEVYLPIM